MGGDTGSRGASGNGTAGRPEPRLPSSDIALSQQFGRTPPSTTVTAAQIMAEPGVASQIAAINAGGEPLSGRRVDEHFHHDPNVLIAAAQGVLAADPDIRIHIEAGPTDRWAKLSMVTTDEQSAEQFRQFYAATRMLYREGQGGPLESPEFEYQVRYGQ